MTEWLISNPSCKVSTKIGSTTQASGGSCPLRLRLHQPASSTWRSVELSPWATTTPSSGRRGFRSQCARWSPWATTTPSSGRRGFRSQAAIPRNTGTERGWSGDGAGDEAGIERGMDRGVERGMERGMERYGERTGDGTHSQSALRTLSPHSALSARIPHSQVSKTLDGDR